MITISETGDRKIFAQVILENKNDDDVEEIQGAFDIYELSQDLKFDFDYKILISNEKIEPKMGSNTIVLYRRKEAD